MAYEKLHEKLGGTWAKLYMLNPLAPITVAVRRVMLYRGGAEMADARLVGFLAIAAALAVLLTVTGWMCFRRLSRDFADEL
jgi:ABC-type polysaccharide/polyol phosphate export permease